MRCACAQMVRLSCTRAYVRAGGRIPSVFRRRSSRRRFACVRARRRPPIGAAARNLPSGVLAPCRSVLALCPLSSSPSAYMVIIKSMICAHLVGVRRPVAACRPQPERDTAAERVHRCLERSVQVRRGGRTLLRRPWRRVACCMLRVACCMLHVCRTARCALACCMLHAARCMLHAKRCMLHVARCTLRVDAARCVWHVAGLRIARLHCRVIVCSMARPCASSPEHHTLTRMQRQAAATQC
jgi:hypothetical protein